MSRYELAGDTLVSLHQMADKDGGWKSVEVEVCHPYSTILHIVGVLVTKKSFSR